MTGQCEDCHSGWGLFCGGRGGRNVLVEFFGWKDSGRDLFRGFLWSRILGLSGLCSRLLDLFGVL